MSIRPPVRFHDVIRRFGRRPFRMLDIGAGNHSATLAKQWFPHCHYTGVDRDRTYHNDDADLAAMDRFIELDLTERRFGALDTEGYDVILLSHVLEHLPNGDDVLRDLIPFLRPGGLLYAEFPGERSRRLPSMRGTLNFHDDPTHVRLFTHQEVSAIVVAGGLRVLRAGTRRDPVGILLMPLLALNALRINGYVPGGVLWDLMGFADVVVAERP